MSATNAICPRCASEQRLAARFCDQCGAAISSAGAATQRLADEPGGLGATLAGLARGLFGGREEVAPTPAAGAHPPGLTPVQELGVCGDYGLIVHRGLRGIADDKTPNVVLEVEYRCLGAEGLTVSQYHWHVGDAQGYFYGCDSYNGRFLGEHERRLPDTLALPGRPVRGWVAFGCPLDAPVSFARFRVGVHEKRFLDMALPELQRRDRPR